MRSTPGRSPPLAFETGSGGEAVAIFNQEIRFPLWWKLRGGVFFDAGNVFGEAQDLDLGDLRTSAGIGIRFQLPIGIIRADYGWVLDRREGEAAGRFHFAFGQAF